VFVLLGFAFCTSLIPTWKSTSNTRLKTLSVKRAKYLKVTWNPLCMILVLCSKPLSTLHPRRPQLPIGCQVAKTSQSIQLREREREREREIERERERERERGKMRVAFLSVLLCLCQQQSESQRQRGHQFYYRGRNNGYGARLTNVRQLQIQ
jgi:hypothetical protein